MSDAASGPSACGRILFVKSKAGLGEEVAKVLRREQQQPMMIYIYNKKQQPAKIVIDKIKYNKYTSHTEVIILL